MRAGGIRAPAGARSLKFPVKCIDFGAKWSSWSFSGARKVTQQGAEILLKRRPKRWGGGKVHYQRFPSGRQVVSWPTFHKYRWQGPAFVSGLCSVICDVFPHSKLDIQIRFIPLLRTEFSEIFLSCCGLVFPYDYFSSLPPNTVVVSTCQSKMFHLFVFTSLVAHRCYLLCLVVSSRCLPNLRCILK